MNKSLFSLRLKRNLILFPVSLTYSSYFDRCECESFLKSEVTIISQIGYYVFVMEASGFTSTNISHNAV